MKCASGNENTEITIETSKDSQLCFRLVGSPWRKSPLRSVAVAKAQIASPIFATDT